MIENRVVVLKFPSSPTPRFWDLRKHINKDWGIVGYFSLGAMMNSQVLVSFDKENQVEKALAKQSHTIIGVRFKAFGWYPHFDTSIEAVIALVWVEIPLLPLVRYLPKMLVSVRNSLAKWISTDKRTLDLANTTKARICVEMNLEEDLRPEYGWKHQNHQGFGNPYPSLCSSSVPIVPCKATPWITTKGRRQQSLTQYPR